MPKKEGVITMGEPEPTRSAAVALIKSYPEAERAVLLAWAQQVIAIRASDLGIYEKGRRIVLVTQELGLAKPLLEHLLSEIQRVGWSDRTTTMKGVIAGAGVGLLASVAAPMAGVAAFGTAIAVPVLVLGAGAGALLAAIVEELG